MMKYVFVSLVLLLLPIVNAHLLLGSWAPESGDPIENHLSDKETRVLETVVDDEVSKHCPENTCEKGVLGYFHQLVGFLRDRLD